jgi:hypothetical protein
MHPFRRGFPDGSISDVAATLTLILPVLDPNAQERLAGAFG